MKTLNQPLEGEPVQNGIGLTQFTKTNGPLSKHISLGANGKVISNGGACVMGRGFAKRLRAADLYDLASVLVRSQSNEALGLGTLRPDLDDEVAVFTKDSVARGANGISRTASNIIYRKGSPAFALLDYDTKGMTPDVAAQLVALGGFWKALCTVLPVLGSVGHLLRASTSAGLSRTDTGETFAGSGGVHGYVVVKESTDAVRFLATLHERCWLAGFGWMMVGAGGQLLERSIVDRMVGAAERLVFEGAPVVVHPLKQDVREPVVVAGDWLDTVKDCPPLTVMEKTTLGKMRAAARLVLAPEAARARAEFIATHKARLMDRTGMSAAEAEAAIELQTRGILLASIELPFDDDELTGKCVGDVLDDPAFFEGEHLADPLEGIEYGRGKAKVMRGAVEVFINSFAHGHAIYKLRYDATTIAKEIAAMANTVPPSELLENFARLVALAELSASELFKLKEDVKGHTNMGIKVIDATIKQAKLTLAARLGEEARELQEAGRNDPRPPLLRAPDDAPLTDEIGRINTVISEAPLEEQFRRDLEGLAVTPRLKVIPNTHAYSSSGDVTSEAPEQWVIGRLDKYGLMEAIEGLIDYVDEGGRSVAPQERLVKAYMKRFDQVLHTLAAIATQPIVLADGGIIGNQNGFDKDRGIQFEVPPAIAAMVPKPEDCTSEAVAKAMHLLTDDWMADVKTDYIGKCVMIALALTIIERSLLDQRPVFFCEAGRASTGKTTLIKMIIAAVTGMLAAAAAWSMDENERRKAITAYFLSGAAYILWDNIPRGEQIQCPHVERSCTSAIWSDRVLGVSEVIATSAATIHVFDGNAIGAKGDTAGRALICHLETNRHDPENRTYKHPDIVNWTLDNRGEILKAMYTILLGNPTLNLSRDAQMQTRFPMWWRLVGSAVEHASLQAVAANPPADPAAQPDPEAPPPPEACSFKQLFLDQRDEDDADASWGAVLYEMSTDGTLPAAGFLSNQVADVINGHTTTLKTLLRGFFLQPTESVSPDSVGRMLRTQKGNVVQWGGRDVALKNNSKKGSKSKASIIWRVEWQDGQPPPVRAM